MKRLVLPGLCLIVALLIAGCQNSAPAVSAPSLRQSPAASAAPASEGDLESTDMVQSSDGRMSVLGKTALFVSLKAMSAPPSAPSGWEFVGPVFDVIAQDRQRRPVHKLASALKLRFSVPTDGAVTVMVFDGAGWQVVPSDVDADGSLVADVDHLTPYVAASPKQASAIRRAPTVVPKVTPGARATVVTAPVSSSDALTELQNAAAAVKGKKVKVSSPAGYA
ncbi:MAG: hypothetical protein M1570_06625, partial [Chloroflexi bacterium]|nr:hypothetical protein [Chloroflexota bacterium]